MDKEKMEYMFERGYMSAIERVHREVIDMIKRIEGNGNEVSAELRGLKKKLENSRLEIL